MEDRCYPCDGCTLGSGGAGDALRVARSCACDLFVAYTRSWRTIIPVGWVTTKRVECWDFARYVVAPSRSIAVRRAFEACPGADENDVLVVIENEARVLVLRQVERIGAAMLAAEYGNFVDAGL
jgi:hypothetical protein